VDHVGKHFHEEGAKYHVFNSFVSIMHSAYCKLIQVGIVFFHATAVKMFIT